MTVKKNEAGNSLPMIVTEGVTVNVLPSELYEYVMTTREVAYGYGTSKYSIQKAFLRNNTELSEGKHYITARTFCPHDTSLPHNAVLWTKRGIIRLGFFIKSERAKLFRDWAEELIIRVDQERDLFGVVKITKSFPSKTKANRLTQERMVSILAEVCRIEDKELRMSITTKLMGGKPNDKN